LTRVSKASSSPLAVLAIRSSLEDSLSIVIAYLFTGLLIDGSPKKNPTTKEVGIKYKSGVTEGETDK
jgi:hypothetical protein